MTAGQVLVNALLPEDLRDHKRVLDKKEARALSLALAQQHPDKFAEVMQRLFKFGAFASRADGATLSLDAFDIPPQAKAMRAEIKKKVVAAINNDKLNDKARAESIVSSLLDGSAPLEKALYEGSLERNNPFALQILSGSRGGKGDLRSLLAGDLAVQDHRGNIVPIPMLHGYAEGLSPAEYFAGAYGARTGAYYTKFMTAAAGFLGKQLVQGSHRQVVTEKDCGTKRSISVDAQDPDNDGVVLAEETDQAPIGSVLSKKIWERMGDRKIKVRSPLTCQAERGVCSKCVGIRETGNFPEIGDNVGVAAAQSLTEKISQSSLSAKHGGGRASAGDNRVKGFDLFNQLIQVPSSFKDKAPLAPVDGRVRDISAAPQGGFFVDVGGQQMHVPAGQKVMVKPGQLLEAGDLLSDGIPNPAEMAEHKGIGVARQTFVEQFRDGFRRSNMSANRRNIELVARGLVNHVKVTDLDGPGAPGDIAEYDEVARNWEPRRGSYKVQGEKAEGKWLEQEEGPFTIGTRITPRVAASLKGVPVTVHDTPPPFQPKMVRAMENLSRAPDWRVRLGGSYLERGLVDAVNTGATSNRSESYIPGIAEGTGFGKEIREKGVY